MNCSQRLQGVRLLLPSTTGSVRLTYWKDKQRLQRRLWAIKAPRLITMNVIMRGVWLRWVGSAITSDSEGHWCRTAFHLVSLGGLLSTEQVKLIARWLEDKLCRVKLSFVDRISVNKQKKKSRKISISNISCPSIIISWFGCFFKLFIQVHVLYIHISAGAFWVKLLIWSTPESNLGTPETCLFSTVLIEVHSCGTRCSPRRPHSFLSCGNTALWWTLSNAFGKLRR